MTEPFEARPRTSQTRLQRAGNLETELADGACLLGGKSIVR